MNDFSRYTEIDSPISNRDPRLTEVRSPILLPASDGVANRAAEVPTEGWYEVETAGQFYNARANVLQVLDAQAFDSMVNRLKAAKAAAGDNFGGLLVDLDHFSDDDATPTESQAWVFDLRRRGDGDGAALDAYLRWTSAGHRRVSNREYKFFSTVYRRGASEKIGQQKIGGRAADVLRPLALEKLAITNEPNNKNHQPIANRKSGAAGGKPPNQPNNEPPNEPDMKPIAKALGLREDASEESVLNAVRDLQTERDTLKNRASDLEGELEPLRKGLVDSALEKYANRFSPDAKDKWRNRLGEDYKGTVELLESLPEPKAEGGEKKKVEGAIHNRADAKAPAEEGEEAKAKADEAKATKIRNRAAEIQRDQKVSHSQAWNLAKAEIGD